jgi:hypothetical protein
MDVSRSSILSELHKNFKPLNVFFTQQCTSPRRNWVSSGLVLIQRSALMSPATSLDGPTLQRIDRMISLRGHVLGRSVG